MGMGFRKIPTSKGTKKPAFGGKRVTKTMPPDKKTLESFGGARTKPKEMEARIPGNREFGFIQDTPQKATLMKGMAPPKTSAAKSGTRADSRKQFKPKAGRKAF